MEELNECDVVSFTVLACDCAVLVMVNLVSTSVLLPAKRVKGNNNLPKLLL